MQKIHKQKKLLICNIKITEICYLHCSKKQNKLLQSIFQSQNTWKGIKSIITIKNLSSDIPKSLSSNGSTITNQVGISNVFNNYSATIAGKTKEDINPSHKHFSHFLKNRHHNSFFLSPTTKSEILSVISSLDSNKSVGPNSIPIKILKLLKNYIYSQLADIFKSHSPQVFFQLY